MASYVTRTMSDGEVVVYTARLSLWRFAKMFLYAIALVILATYMLSASWSDTQWQHRALIVYVVAIFLALWPLILRRSTELVITDRRAVAKTGIVSTSALEIRFNKIETIRVDQSVLGRLLNFGSITIIGTGSTFDPIAYIAKPLHFKNQLSRAMDTQLSGTHYMGAVSDTNDQ